MELKLKRDYLTSVEIEYIVTQILQCESAYDKEILQIGLVAQILLESLPEDFTSCAQIYDYLLENEVDLETLVSNYYMIDKIYEEETSVSNTVAKFLEGFASKIEEYAKTVDMASLQNIVDQMKELGVK